MKLPRRKPKEADVEDVTFGDGFDDAEFYEASATEEDKPPLRLRLVGIVKSLRVPNVSSLPSPVRTVLSVSLVVFAMFGPHTYVMSVSVQDAELFGELPFGQVPEFVSDAIGTDGSQPQSGGQGTDSQDGDEAEDVAATAAVETLAGLEIRPDEEVPSEEYDRSLFMGSWTDTDGSGCTTREDVLIETFVDAEVDGCEVVAGTGEAVSLYDNVTMTDPSDADIEHVVALQDMWMSGAWQWDEQVRQRAAQDRQNLLAVTASSNRSKGARGPNEWEPESGAGAACQYATIYIEVKAAYELSVTESQYDALSEMVADC